MRFRHHGMALLFLVLLGMGGMGLASGQGESSCASQPLAFRENIRQPDAWEEAWELIWPDASNALQTWRTRQFESFWRCGEPWRRTRPRHKARPRRVRFQAARHFSHASRFVLTPQLRML